MNQPERPLGEHLSPAVSEARLAKQWRNISARVQSRALSPRPARWVLLAGAIATLLVAVLAVGGLRIASNRPEARAAAEHEVVTLPDGSRITLDPGSRMAVTSVEPTRVHVVLESGGIELDIPRTEARTFVVSAANHDITVLGTAFRVRIEEAVLHVGVTRGSVQVAPSGPASPSERLPDGAARRVLSAGENGSFTASAAAPPIASPPVAPTSLPSPTGAVQPQPKSGVGEPPRSGAASGEPPAAAPTPGGSSGPKELLARATDARGAGRSHEAAAAFDQLRKRYRSDPRAGLAAFELGRLRLEALGDAAGALEALDDAVALAPTAPFREDAEARRVDALDALGDPRCAGARHAYLERYPRGVHARSMALRCATR